MTQLGKATLLNEGCLVNRVKDQTGRPKIPHLRTVVFMSQPPGRPKRPDGGCPVSGAPANYEASFLALEGNPLDDWRNTWRTRLRFKHAWRCVLLHPEGSRLC